jgi:putative flippase GtrA
MVRRFLTERTDNTSIQVFRYILAGGVAYAADYVSLILLTEVFGVYYLLSAAIAFLLGTVVSYFLNISWVFNKRTFDSKRIEISIFLLIGIIGLFLNQWSIWFFTEKVGFFYPYSKIIATVIVVLVNFFARKYILFR